MNFKNTTIMKKEYITPAIEVKAVLGEQILQSMSIDSSKEVSSGEAKTQFTIWEYMNTEE